MSNMKFEGPEGVGIDSFRSAAFFFSRVRKMFPTNIRTHIAPQAIKMDAKAEPAKSRADYFRDYHHKYYRDHQDTVCRKSQAYYEANKERILAKKRTGRPCGRPRLGK